MISECCEAVLLMFLLHSKMQGNWRSERPDRWSCRADGTGGQERL